MTKIQATNKIDTEEEETTFSIELMTISDDERPIYLVGNFNGWSENDKRFKMVEVEEGLYRYTFLLKKYLPVPLEYKYVRGEWADDELDEYGNFPPKRVIDKLDGKIKDVVPMWQNKGLEYQPDLLPKIEVLTEEFDMPVSIKTRRIAVLLPHDYEQSDKKYPVLYLQDGQNLFDKYAPFGSWEVDKKLAILKEKGIGDIIVVSIDHAEKERIVEFTPSHDTPLGVGLGKKYVRFLADRLKPFIDKTYRTLTDREHTGIGGSSMGGLISVYAGLMYPEVYGKLMIFSPAFWVSPNIPFEVFSVYNPQDMKIYLYAGGNESKNMIPNVQKFKSDFEKAVQGANIDFQLEIDMNGRHNEARWGREFPKAVEWMFFNKNIIDER